MSLFAGVKMGRIPKVEKERALQLHQAASTSSSSSSSSPLSSLSATAHHVYHATVTTSSQPQQYHMNGGTPSLTAVNGERAHAYVMNRLASASAESSRNSCLHETEDTFQHAHASSWVSANCFETWELCLYCICSSLNISSSLPGICSIAIAYSMGQFIKPVCVCHCVSVSVYPSVGTLTVAFHGRFLP